MSRRAMVVVGFMGVLLLALIALGMWYEWKGLPSAAYVWREFWSTPEFIALAGLGSVIVFLVVCTQSVGLGRWGKVGGALILAGAGVTAIGGYGAYWWTQYDWSGPITSQRVDRFLSYGLAFALIARVGVVLLVGGVLTLTVVAAHQTWRHRKQVFPFLYKGRE